MSKGHILVLSSYRVFSTLWRMKIFVFWKLLPLPPEWNWRYSFGNILEEIHIFVSVYLGMCLYDWDLAFFSIPILTTEPCFSPILPDGPVNHARFLNRESGLMLNHKQTSCFDSISASPKKCGVRFESFFSVSSLAWCLNQSVRWMDNAAWSASTFSNNTRILFNFWG